MFEEPSEELSKQLSTEQMKPHFYQRPAAETPTASGSFMVHVRSSDNRIIPPSAECKVMSYGFWI